MRTDANVALTRYTANQLHALAIFRDLLETPVLRCFLDLLDKSGADEKTRADAYGRFMQALFAEGGDFGEALKRAVLHSENAAVRLAAAGRALPAEMQDCLQMELKLLSGLTALPPGQIADLLTDAMNVYRCRSTPQDLAAAYRECLAQVGTRGYGIFAAYHMFTLGEGAALLPVKNPDPQRLAQLTGYENERGQILVNTRALLRGMAANNILLYGDAGTGKSSTVKAVANAFCAEGLRLVEVRKNQLYQIPLLMDKLADNPLKFILFIDDLSFPADDGEFTALKAILEGNISARPGNIVVYATSNRRHMLRQSHQGRAGDDVHLSDTLEEEASLSARFGLTVTFLRPDRALYADIVRALAAEEGLQIDDTTLMKRAEAHALRYGGRSPRTARQFVAYLKAEGLGGGIE